jgi:hypothetical protein
MGKLYDAIDGRLRAWIEAQHLFFVATAPREGHINCSPRGLDALRIVDGHTVAWIDYVGSGVETIAHLRENGRIVLMFCAFEGPPKIVRLHGTGTIDDSLAHLFEPKAAVRAIIRIDVTRISDSCGYGVPFYRYEGERDQLAKWAAAKGREGIEAYVREKNARSIDGIAGMGGGSQSQSLTVSESQRAPLIEDL